MRRWAAGLMAVAVSLTTTIWPRDTSAKPRAERSSGAQVGCPAIPSAATITAAPHLATTTEQMQPTLLRKGGPRTTIWDSVSGVGGQSVVVLSADQADLCAQVQHGDPVEAVLAKAVLATLPQPTQSSAIIELGGADSVHPKKVVRPKEGEAGARALRSTLATGSSPVLGTLFGVQGGHPTWTRQAEFSQEASAASVVTPCPGLTAYLRLWLASIPAGRPDPPPPKKRVPKRH